MTVTLEGLCLKCGKYPAAKNEKWCRYCLVVQELMDMSLKKEEPKN